MVLQNYQNLIKMTSITSVAFSGGLNVHVKSISTHSLPPTGYSDLPTALNRLPQTFDMLLICMIKVEFGITNIARIRPFLLMYHLHMLFEV